MAGTTTRKQKRKQRGGFTRKVHHLGELIQVLKDLENEKGAQTKVNVFAGDSLSELKKVSVAEPENGRGDSVILLVGQ